MLTRCSSVGLRFYGIRIRSDFGAILRAVPGSDLVSPELDDARAWSSFSDRSLCGSGALRAIKGELGADEGLGTRPWVSRVRYVQLVARALRSQKPASLSISHVVQKYSDKKNASVENTLGSQNR